MPSDALNQNPAEQSKEVTYEEVERAFSKTYLSNAKYEVSRQKEYLRPNRQEESVRKNCSELGTQELEYLLAFCEKYSGTRLIIHVYRLLNNGRSEVEKAFGLAVVQYYSNIESEIKLKDEELLEQLGEDDPVDFQQLRLSGITNSESNDSGMFWTFGPYIYKHLFLKGVEPSEAFRIICNWGLRKEYSQEELKKTQGWHLKGLNQREDEDVPIEGLYYLTLDKNNLTHKFTDQEARKMVDRGLFEEGL